MKKLTAIFLASSMITAVTSCSNGNSESAAPSPLSESAQISLKEADITMADDFSSIISIDKLGDQVLIFGKNTTGNMVGYVTDTTFADYRSFTFTPKDGEIIKSACMSKFDKTAVLTCLDGETILYIYNKNGEIFKESNLGEVIWNQDGGAIITANGEEFIINLNGEGLAAVESDGTYAGEIDLKNRSIYGFSKNNEDIPTVILGDNNGKTEIAAIDGSVLGETQKCSSLSSSAYAICGGNEQYSLVANFGDGLYGLNGSEWLKITDFMDNSFSAYELFGLIATGENEFAALTSASGETSLKLLTERDISELKSKKIISLATFGSAAISFGKDIKEFNNTNDDYRIELRTYSEAGNYPNAADIIREDILSGDPPDIIQNYNFGLSVDSFGARETLFVDLYELIDSDPKLSREDFLDGYLEAMDFNGKLLAIAPSFTISTLAVKDKYLDGITEWNASEMMKNIANRPENMGIFPYAESFTRTEMMMNIGDYGSFIDYEKAECYFDSPEFINTMKEIQENELGMTQAELNAIVGDDGGHFWEPVGNRYRYFWDDNYLISRERLTSMSSLLNTIKGKFNEPATFIGNPNDHGAGTKFTPDEDRTFSIMRSCQHIDGAWEFLRECFFTENYYHDYDGKAKFAAIEKYLGEQIEETKEAEMYENPETGEMENYNYYILDDMAEEKYYFDPFTDEEAQKYGDFVREAAKHRERNDSVAYDILWEELMTYFEGERSAEETADIIQNRITIYLSEHYG